MTSTGPVQTRVRPAALPFMYLNPLPVRLGCFAGVEQALVRPGCLPGRLEAALALCLVYHCPSIRASPAPKYPLPTFPSLFASAGQQAMAPGNSIDVQLAAGGDATVGSVEARMGWAPFNHHRDGKALLGQLDLAFLGAYACEPRQQCVLVVCCCWTAAWLLPACIPGGLACEERH
jgi:hypothetical protein